MSGKNPSRTCEDVDDTALSYAEIKALCAGDPKIKLKMDLEIEVQRLNAVRSGYLSEKYHMEDDLTRRYPQQIKNLQNEIAAYEADLATLAANTPADPEQFSMTVDGETYREAKEAGVALLAYSKTLVAGESAVVGTYRGLPLEIDCYKGLSLNNQLSFDLQVQGRFTYSVDMGEDARGNITRLDNRLMKPLEDLAENKERIAIYREQMETIRVELEKPWPLEQGWREKTAQLAEVTAELNTAGTEPVVDDTPPEPSPPALASRSARTRDREPVR